VAAVPAAISSQQAKYRLFNGRPDGLRGPPISIYHESFGIFRDAMAQDTPLSHEDYVHAYRFIEVAQKTYRNEKARETAMNFEFSKILDLLVEAKDYETTKTDGSGGIVINIDGNPVFVELFANEYKNEIGQGHVDPTIQLGFTMRKIWTAPIVSHANSFSIAH
jgi:hypothetical protein